MKIEILFFSDKFLKDLKNIKIKILLKIEDTKRKKNFIKSGRLYIWYSRKAFMSSSSNDRLCIFFIVRI